MSDRPSDDGGSARSDAASRLAALLADVVDDPAPPAPSPQDPDEAAPRARRVVRRRDLVERDDAPPVAPDPDATQPIPTVAPPPAPPAPAPPVAADDEVAARRAREREEGVLAEARGAVAAGGGSAPTTGAGAPVALRKQPGRPWSRSTSPETPAPAPPPAPRKAASAPPPPKAIPRKAAEPTAAPEPAPVAPAARAAEADEPDPTGRAPRLTLRAVAFGVVLAVLMAAVPALGWAGKDRLLESTGGEIVDGGTNDPAAPGYSQLVQPTPTALVVHRDASGTPVLASVLSLTAGAGGEGGTVLLVPLQLQPVEGSFFHRIIDGYASAASDDGFRRSIEDVIQVSVPPPVIDITDESLATLVAPVAPLSLTVTDPVTADNGVLYEGPVSLSAEEVGPYLRATREGEPEVAHLERVRDVWDAWLTAIGEATGTEPIGAAATGMGSFLRVLAAGDPVVETLDVVEEPDYLKGTSYVPADGMDEQIIDAVPFPVSPREGTRFSIRLLNGAEGATLPMPLMRELIQAGGSLSMLGNASGFGQEDTLIEYDDESWRDEAEALQELLGDGVEIDQMSSRRADAEDEDMVITIGSDVLSRYEQ